MLSKIELMVNKGLPPALMDVTAGGGRKRKNSSTRMKLGSKTKMPARPSNGIQVYMLVVALFITGSFFKCPLAASLLMRGWHLVF